MNYPSEQARRRIRRQGWLLATALALMAIFFGLAPLDEAALDFTRRYGEAPFILEYRLVFLAYLGLALLNVVRLSARYARIADRPALRLGLRVVVLGGLFGLAFVVHEGLYVGALRLGFAHPLANAEAITQILMAAAVGLTVIGSTLPAWGPHVGLPALYEWARRYRAYRSLYHLWLAFYRANPQVVLLPPRSPLADMFTLHDLRFRLYRQVVEIRDSRLLLQPFFETRISDRARVLCELSRLSQEETELTVEAATIAAALRAKARGLPPLAPISHRQTAGGADLDSEIAWLEKIAHRYERSPVVRAILAELEAEAAGPTAGARQLVE